MRANVWGPAFILAVIIHITGLALAGQGLLREVLEEKTEYMEVELASVPPVKEKAQYQSASAPTDCQSNKAISNVIGAAATPLTPGFVAVGDRNVTAPVSATVSEGGQVTEINGGGSGAATGTGVMGTAGAGSGAAPAQPMEEQEVDRRPYPVYSPSPEYPQEARLNRWQGTVVARVLVKASGNVADVRVAQSSGYNELDQAAEEVLYQWRFNPAYRNGQPVTAWVKVPVAFKLTR